MTDIRTQPSTNSFLNPSKFRMLIQGLEDVNFFIQSVDFPAITAQEVEQLTPRSTIYHPGDTLEYEELTVTFLLSENFENWKSVYDWMKTFGTPVEPTDLDDKEINFVRDIQLQLMTNNNTVVKVITFKDCFPTNLSGFNLDSAMESIEPLPIPLTFRFTTFDIVGANSGSPC